MTALRKGGSGGGGDDEELKEKSKEKVDMCDQVESEMNEALLRAHRATAVAS